LKKLAIALLVLTGCASVPRKAVPVFAPPADTDGVLALIGRFSIGHGCAIGPNEYVTAAHVIDPVPFDRNAPLVGATWSDNRGGSGVLIPGIASRAWDLGFGAPSSPFKSWYKVAEEAPKVGEKLWLRAWDFSSSENAFDEPILEVTVSRIKAGYIIIRESIPAGTSGGCVLNAKSEVTAIVSFGKSVGREGNKAGEVGGLVSIYGPWLDMARNQGLPDGSGN
jgi:hypothetical protein